MSESAPVGTAQVRSGHAPADMVRALFLVAAFAVATLLISPARTLLFPGNRPAVQVVGYADQVLAAREFSRDPIWAPTGLGPGWRATSARDSGGGGAPTTLHIGFVTPSGQYAALEETDGPAGPFLATVLGTVAVAGSAWVRHPGVDGATALVRTVHGVTLVVQGTAGLAELRALAASLQKG
ncbi:MAG TPA: DUF4245 domain-containing protein [Mycobacteriales bacterium]|nr:DUF4245 domain-containing protein [Mycobacteriales bacterium]